MRRICSNSSRETVYLIRTIELSKTNSDTVGQEIINTMIELYGGSINYDKLHLIISDAAPYAIKAVNVMKFLFPNMKHVTCIAHMLHRLCEKLRDISPNTNFICSEIKKN
ncbi:hypothetical protein DMUE_0472 [Dictyocoela muelleri]|nr:hypothetical protein DMUE_0472 [Dictyocoela muelleri]